MMSGDGTSETPSRRGQHQDEPPRYAPYDPGPRHWLTPTTDSRAALSLAFGITSLVTCGLTGIPAVVLGFGAQSSIRSSRGRLVGSGMAAWGIATGILGTVLGMVALTLVVVGTVMSARTASTAVHPSIPAPEATAPAWSPTAPTLSAGPTMVGAIRVVDLDVTAHATFRQQLEGEYHRATSAHQTLILMTNKRKCDVCDEIAASLSDARMQTALAHVEIVRVDVDDFAEDLHAGGMLEETLPWFYKVDASLHPVDAVSAGEWAENVPENMAPVLGSFVAGTLRIRRDPSSLGTSL
jgi:hypothetical protein